MARLTFYGAVEGVTGSAYLLETEQSTALLECGLIQGSHEEEQANNEPFAFPPTRLDCVILSHAHLDHSGRLPKLVADGFPGTLYMTHATRELLEIMLKDAAFLAQRDANWENKRRRRAGKSDIQPLYTLEDVEETMARCRSFDYDQRHRITSDIEVRYRDAGHILGSAIVEVFISEEGREKKLVFSGDLGNNCAALLRDPEVVREADVLLLESTYGDRDHKSMESTLGEFEDILNQAVDRPGNVIIPSFAVGRTQEIIFRLGELFQKGKLRQREVYLDSPMAIAATEIYHRFQNMFNPEDSAILRHERAGSLHSLLPILRYSRSTEESMALNLITEGAVIIAGSGMCNGGRIRHHLKHNLWRENAHIIFVGYQAIGTPGRALVDGAKMFHFGKEEDIAVRAKIHTLGGFSAHASQSQLLAWAGNFSRPRPELYLVHGEDHAKTALQSELQNQDWPANIPSVGESITF